MVGPYPEAAERYRERSPIHAFDRISVPVLVLQGLEDRVVVPAEAEAIGRRLDVVGVNPYYPMQDALEHPKPSGQASDTRPQWMPFSGAWWLYLQADMAYGAAQGPFLVTETNAGAIGDSHSNYPAYDGQWRQAVWAFVATASNQAAAMRRLRRSARISPRPVKTCPGSSRTST